MRPAKTKFTWRTNSRRAALLVAQDKLTDERIATECGVSKATLERWKDHPDFRAKVSKRTEEILASLRDKGIAEKSNRIASLNDRWEKLHQVIRERGADPSMVDIPGGTTGLVVRQLKSIGVGQQNQMVEEYVVDTGTLAEMRAMELQAAKELGQLIERKDVRVSIEEEARRLADELGIDPDELIREAERIVAEIS